MEIEELLMKQKEFFEQGKTLSYKTRKNYLIQLKNKINQYKPKLYQAIYKDLNKSETEAFMCEIGLVLSDLNYQIKHLKKNMKKKHKKTPLAQFKGKSYIEPSPYGNTLIISPWNYPILLSLEPFVGAIAAGNTVILKPSEYSLETSDVLKELISEVFPEEYATVVLGDAIVASKLLDNEFDYIFFTGGTKIGKKVALAASKYLTPMTLELGGKSPVIVDDTAKINLAAKRIVFGKFLNAGQTCVAPDYVLVCESKKEELVQALTSWIKKFYPNSLENSSYVKMINERHFNRVMNYINTSKVIYGGNSSKDILKIEPTLLDSSLDELVMQEEIFGPALPILTYKTNDELLNTICKHPNPLALYIFSTKKKNINWIISHVQFGGGCVNDTIIHLATNELPFGGVRQSGIGSYHGKKTFETFSHYKSILSKANWIDLPIRYTPYTKKKRKLIQFFIK
ncbi:MAG: aldehyde dehydrogenase [Roseburia sp.]|nr:aldehyde dehydrogenase [Anaeroplasma bactoclasticum]MCM1196711.1 aldehyde dehydrogenase [Roseburia sp.]MCM1557729.1 aldehyde dehydrogenase [Anaeroplasma bactoclasticum]